MITNPPYVVLSLSVAATRRAGDASVTALSLAVILRVVLSSKVTLYLPRFMLSEVNVQVAFYDVM